jgi:O-antigen ligase
MAVASTLSRPSTTNRRQLWAQLLLSALVLSAFLTQTKVIPGIESNFGAFELMSLVVFGAFFLGMPGSIRLQRLHPVVALLLAIAVSGGISQLLIPRDRWHWSLIDLSILVFFFVFVFFLHSIVISNRIRPIVFLRGVVYSLLLIGPWIAYQGVNSGGDIHAVGPFRNRSHMAYYMLTGFWLALMYRFWPGLPRWQRWISYIVLASCLYAVAVSGRRSVYLALGIGLAGLGVSFLGAQRGRRARFILTAVFLIALVGLFYNYGATLFPRAKFFQERLQAIGGDLKNAFTPADEVTGEDSFIALQRQGALAAFRSSPLIGIGWGGFYRSQFSPTGHEVHSTPLRFLSELGLIGISLYTFFMAYLLFNSARLARQMRGSPFGNVYLSMALGLWSMSVSYLYPRHVPERTFWLLVVIYLSMELMAGDYRRYLARKQALKLRASQATKSQPHASPRTAAVPR